MKAQILKLNLIIAILFTFNSYSQVVLNEIMVRPPGTVSTPPNGLIYVDSQEYIEIYNNSCSSMNISGYFIAMKQNLSSINTGGTFRIPNIPAANIPAGGHVVIGSSSAAGSAAGNIDIPITAADRCLYNGNFVLANTDGWCALYNASGVAIDCVYWSSNISNLTSNTSDFNPPGGICLPSGSPAVTLQTPFQINGTTPSIVRYGGPNPSAGNPLSRQQDGANTWVQNLASSIAANNCNGGTCVTPSSAPSAPSVTTPVNYCQGATAVPLTATPSAGGTLNWYGTSATGGTASPTAPTPSTATVGSTTYYVSQTVGGCESPRAALVVNVNTSWSSIISCGTSTASSVTFDWTFANFATGYSISYQVNSGSPINIGSIGNVLTYTVNSLNSGDNVTITVTPLGGSVNCYTATSFSCSTINSCPTILSPSSDQNVCLGGDPTAFSVNTTFTGNNAISFVFFNSQQTGSDMYSSLGTLIGNATPSAGIATFNPGVLGTTGSLPNTAGTYYVYAIANPTPAVVGCRPFQEIRVVVNAQPNAGTDGNTAICDSSVASIDLFSLITGEQAGGTWTRLTGTGGTFTAGTGTFVPASGATTSTFQYSLAGTAPCVNDVSIATININAQPNAGTDGNTAICDSSVASIDLFSLITGEQLGGTWTRLTGTGGTFNAGAGTFVPASGATTSTFQYSLAGTAPCVNDVSIATININAQPNAGTDGNIAICDSSVASIDLFSLITGEQAGGTWTRLTGTGGTFTAGTGTFVPASGATTSTFQYSLAGTAPCVNDVSIATININAQPKAGTDGNTAICDNSVASIDLFSLITGEQSGGTWTRLTGTGGTFTAGTGTFVPASGATTSTFQYSLAGTAPCVNDVSIATININAQPNAGTDGNIAICDSSVASIDLFSLITGEQAGGTWTRLTGTGGTFTAGTGTFVPASGATTSTFQYSLAGTAPCVNDVSIATININAQPKAGTDGNTAICDNSVASIDLFSLITGEQSGGTWTRLTGTGGTFTAGTGTFVPASGATTSTFQYSLAGTAPCVNDVSIATININAQPNAGTDGNIAICDSSVASIDLFSLITGEQAGGTWTRLTGTGGTFTAGTGTFVPASGATTSTFQYSLAGTAPCVNDVSIATININAQPKAGTDGNTAICDNSVASIDLFSLITGEQSGGTWTRLTGTGGTFTAGTGTFVPASGATTSTFQYSLAGTAPCVNDVSIATININAQPNAGTDGNIAICDSSVASIDLFSLITGEQAGGTWTRLTGTGGTFTAGTGTFVPASGATTSTFQYSLAGTAPCVNDVSIATININAQPKAGTDGNTAICDNSVASIDLFSLITGEQSGGTWTRLTGTGGTFTAGTGTFVPASGATTSTFQYSLAGTAPCVNDVSIATININAQPNAGTDGNIAICDSSVASIDLFSLITGEQAGGTWTRLTGTGGTFTAGTGTFVPASGATTSTFQYSLAGTAPCVNDVSIATININAQPKAGTDGNTAICDNSVASIDLFSLITGEQSGGTWTRLTGTGGTFTAGTGTFVPASGATTSTFQYSLAGTAPCVNDVSIATININAQPNAGTDGNIAICDSSVASIDLFSLITGEQAGGTWTRLTGTGGTFTAGTGTFVPASGATTSTFQYSLAGTAPCVNDVSIATININAQPKAGTDGNTAICDNSVASIDLFSLITGEQSGGTWTRLTGTGGTFTAGTGTFVPASGATTSTFQYSLAGTAPCVNDVSIATININAQPNAGTDGNIAICDSSVASIDLFSLITGEQAGGTWTRLTGTGGTFTAGTGTFVPASGATTSTFQYSLAGTAPCVNDVSIATININAQPKAGTDGNTAICDNSVASIDLFSLITGEQSGGTWTRLTGTGGTFTAGTGTFVPASGATTSTFQYSLAGTAPCVNDVSIATININAQPNAGTDGNIAICDSSVASIDLFSLITGEQAGGTWTRLTGTGGTFTAGTGTFVPASGATTSTFQYSLAGTAPCVNDVSIATININAQPKAGTDGNTAICDNSVASIDLFSLITGEQSGGTWTRLTGTGGTFTAGTGTFVPASGATTSTFQYSLAGTAPCVNDVSIATININAQPNAGTDGNIAICDSSVASIDLFSLITGEQAGGTWTRLTGTGGTFTAGTGTFVPASGATTSTFQYSLAGTAPCVNDVSIATININAQPKAGTDGNTAICDNSVASIDLFSLITGEQSGGTWTRLTGTGGTFTAGTGTFVPASGATTSTFQYSLAGTAPCVNDVSIATININAQPNAGTDGNIAICDSSVASIDLFSLITGEQAGGTWTRLTGTGGTFTAGTGTFVPASGATTSTFQYSLAGTAPCVNDVSIATININAQPKAGTDGNTAICDNSVASIDLFSLITGEQSGGTWTRLTGTGGTFTAGTGTFVPASGATTSTFQYSLAGTAPCVNDVSIATININAQPNAGTDGNIAICDSSVASIDLFSLITGEQAGGTWTRLTGTGGTFTAGTGTFVPASGATTSTFQYSLAGTAPCVNDVSIATININAQPKAGTDGNTAICDNSVASIDLFSLITGEQSGGTWTRLTGTGGTFTAGTGTFVPASGATTSTFQYSLAGTAPCVNDVSIATININAQPNAGTDGNIAICDSSVASIDLFSLITGEQAGGTWTRLTGTGGTFTAGTGTFVPASGATTSTFQYSLAGTAPCINDSSVATIQITSAPVLTYTVTNTVCNGSTLNFAFIPSITGTTYIWSATVSNISGFYNTTTSGNETNINNVATLTNPEAIGTITMVIIPRANGCDGIPQTVVITVNPNPLVEVVAVADTSVCSATSATNNVQVNISGNISGITYNWTAITNGVTVVGGTISGTITATSTTASFGLQVITSNPLVAGTIYFEVSAVRNGCVGNTLQSAVVTVNPNPGVAISSPDKTICSGDPTDLMIDVSPLIVGTEIEWEVLTVVNVSGANPGSGIAPQPINDILTSTTGGYVIYRVRTSLGDCEGTFTDYRVNVNPAPLPILADGNICITATGDVYQTYTLNTGLNNTDYDFEWFDSNGNIIPGETNATLVVDEAGTYSVIATNWLTGCSSDSTLSTATATVTETLPATTMTVVQSEYFSDNATITVNVTGGTGTLMYSLDEGPLQSSNVFTGVSPGVHLVTVIDTEGCTYLTQEVTIIDYPNYFTPNGDGINDTWNIIGLNQPDAKLYIFDRYGKLIKQLSATDNSNGWDGMYNQEQLPSTDYWFTLDYTENGAVKQFKSHFSLKR